MSPDGYMLLCVGVVGCVPMAEPDENWPAARDGARAGELEIDTDAECEADECVSSVICLPAGASSSSLSRPSGERARYSSNC